VSPVEVSLWWRIIGWALVIVIVLLSLIIVPVETKPCVRCGRPSRTRDRLGRPVCYLHDQVRR
jgi:hypothetical protein